MAWTSHGHHIPGTVLNPDDRPKKIARCGGTNICQQCRRDITSYRMTAQADKALSKIEPQTNQILRYFEYGHLPPVLGGVSAPFQELALKLDRILPDGPEKSTALRKLLEGKDAAVRAALDIVEK